MISERAGEERLRDERLRDQERGGTAPGTRDVD